MRALGVQGFPMVAIEHPLGGERPDGVSRRARQAVEQIRALLGKASSTGESASVPTTGQIGRAEPASATATGQIGRAEPASIYFRPPSVEAGLTDLVTIDTP